ncbi:MAG: 3-deoxy-manno-octulosonate cytidylyltransferase [Phycisphaerales bacterium]|nr:MAG: 3-deoxy-manno-octulosonate cytidylyltransferase [Phycisphaerales bacterium]
MSTNQTDSPSPTSPQPPAIVGLIPARLASSRFPEKVLAKKTGKPLIQHVVESARRSATLSRIVVATDHPRIEEAVRSFGGECVMTSAEHPNGTSRLAEAAERLALGASDIVVNIQGDEPEIDPGVIDAAVARLIEQRTEVATVASPFAHDEDAANPNIVKVVLSREGHALYFSRSLIPYPRNKGGGGGAGEGSNAVAPTQPLKHIGLYVYRVSFLRHYVALPPTPLEQTEFLEQLRVLEHGYRIAVAVRAVHTQGIDTPEQYEAFARRVMGMGV